MKTYNAVIVGAGSMGMAAGYYLAKTGVRTLLIDAFDPPHTMGSHHGDTRIIRFAYGEGSDYVPLALRAQELWNELEQEAGETLFLQTGVVSVGKKDDDFLRGVRESSERFNLPLEAFSAAGLHERWPGITVPDDFCGYLESAAGVLYSERCISAYRKLAVQHGADLLTNTRVTAIKPDTGGVTVETDSGSYRGEKLLLSAGAWNPSLLQSLGLHLPIVPTRKTVGWFAADEALYSQERFPAFVFSLENSSFYGFPDIDGTGLKIGRHDSGEEIDPDRLDRTFGTHPADEGELRSFLETYMPKAAGALRQGRVCIYSVTPDENFVIDRHPEYPHLVIAAGFSGHGFKFASAIGEVAAQLLTEGSSSFDLSLFSLSRF
ncbi:N-methyl-L-tryptophan oxidase [Brevibacillus sp. TJ4]|uniref:N-methyl-L-tryptophan oxidase n=1 Tax=Brevibacillus sp. TJ4 TaxID=3234853 RepID=UPI003B9E6918